MAAKKPARKTPYLIVLDELAEMRRRVRVLEAQVKSLQFAVPRGVSSLRHSAAKDKP